MIKKIKSFFQEKESKKLVSNVVALLLLQVVNYILPLLTVPYLFQTLEAEKFGVVAFASSIVMFLQVIVDYGYNLSGTRVVSTHMNDKAKLTEIFSSIMIIKFFLIILTLFLLTLLIFIFDKIRAEAFLFYITFGIVIGQALFPTWFFQGLEEMKYITYINATVKLFFTLCVFLFVNTKSDYYIVPLLTSIGSILAGIFSIKLLYKTFAIKFQLQNKKIILKYFKESFNIFITEFMPNVYNNFSTVLLGFISNMDSVGYFSLATKIIGIFNSILQVLKTATFPYLNKNFTKFNAVAKIMISSGLILSLILITSSHALIPLIFGPASINALNLVYILSLSPFLASILFMYGTNKLLVLKKDQEFKNITFIYSIFGFCSASLLIPLYGAYGAAITLLLTRTLMAVLVYIYARRYN